jgi:hypothetical protein
MIGYRMTTRKFQRILTADTPSDWIALMATRSAANQSARAADAAVATAGFGAFFSRASEFSYRAQQLPSMTERHLDLFYGVDS